MGLDRQRALLFVRHGLRPAFPEDWDRQTLSYFKGRHGEDFRYEELPWGSAFVQYQSGRRILHYARVQGVNGAAVEGGILGWPCYNEQGLAGLNPAVAYCVNGTLRRPAAWFSVPKDAEVYVRDGYANNCSCSGRASKYRRCTIDTASLVAVRSRADVVRDMVRSPSTADCRPLAGTTLAAGLRTDHATTELASVERCLPPETLNRKHFATTQLACVERCFRRRRKPGRQRSHDAISSTTQNIIPPGQAGVVMGKKHGCVRAGSKHRSAEASSAVAGQFQSPTATANPRASDFRYAV